MQNIHISMPDNIVVFFWQTVLYLMSVPHSLKNERLRSNSQVLTQVVSYMEEREAKWIEANNLTMSEILEHFNDIVFTCGNLLLFW